MAGSTTPAAPLRVLLLGTDNSDGTTTGVTAGTSQPVNAINYPNITIYVTASALLSAGTLIVEESDMTSYSAAVGAVWSQVTSVTLSSTFSGAGGATAIHLGGPGGQYAYDHLRVRIGTGVSGGNVTARLVAN